VLHTSGAARGRGPAESSMSSDAHLIDEHPARPAHSHVGGMCRGNRTLPRVARKCLIVIRTCLRVSPLWRVRKSSLETILDDLYFLVDAVPRMASSGPVRPVAAVAVQLFRRRDGGVRAPPRTQVRWLCLGARSCRRLITVEGGRAGWLVALPEWWPVRSGPGRWSWPHTVRYRLPRRAWSWRPCVLDGRRRDRR